RPTRARARRQQLRRVEFTRARDEGLVREHRHRPPDARLRQLRQAHRCAAAVAERGGFALAVRRVGRRALGARALSARPQALHRLSAPPRATIERRAAGVAKILRNLSEMSFFITVLATTDSSRREFEAIPKMTAMLNRGLSPAEYRAFLHDLYYVVWHFCPTMAAAAARCDDRFRQVRYELYERIEEEKGHEMWVLEDLEAVGGDAARVRSHLPSAPMQCMI